MRRGGGGKRLRVSRESRMGVVGGHQRRMGNNRNKGASSHMQPQTPSILNRVMLSMVERHDHAGGFIFDVCDRLETVRPSFGGVRTVQIQ